MNKKKFIIALSIGLFSLFFLSATLQSVEAQAVAQKSYSGNDVCGKDVSSACTLQDAKGIINNVITGLVLPLVFAFLTLFIMLRIVLAYKAYVEGNASAWKEARTKIANGLLGLLIITLVFGGFFATLLSVLGVQPWVLKLLQILSQGLVPHAYAQEVVMSTGNPVQATSLYDFLLLFVRLTIRWFIYPAVIGMWVWSGFSFVLAQGRPEAITKAKKFLGWAVACTILILVTEGFLFAIRNTIAETFTKQPSSQTTSQTPEPTPRIVAPDGRVAPESNTAGASCQNKSNGLYGIVGTNNECIVRPVDPGTSCSTVDGRYGRIGADGTTCYVTTGGR